MKKETRTFSARATSPDSKTIRVAISYGTVSQDLGGFVETVKPGAFTQALRDHPDVVGLWQHLTHQPLGRVGNGTMQIRDTAASLNVTIQPNLDTSYGRDALASVKRGDVTGASFGFTVAADEWGKHNGANLRTITRVERVFDISPCTFGAYPQSTSRTRKGQTAMRTNTQKRVDDLLAQHDRSILTHAPHTRRSEWRNLEDFLQAIIEAGESQGGSVPAPIVRTSNRKGKSKIIVRDRLERKGLGVVSTDRRLIRSPMGLGEDAPSGGAFLLPEMFSDKMLDVKSQSYPLPGMCSHLRLTKSGKVKLPYLDDAISVYLVDEAGEKTKSKPGFGGMEIVLNKIIGLAYASDELMADYGLLAKYLFSHIGERIQQRLQNYIINGTGAGQPLGILNSPALITEPRAGASAISNADVTDMWAHLWAQGKQRAVWFANSETTSTQIFAAAMGPIYDAPTKTLLGRPVFEISECPTIGLAGDLILMDPLAYIVVDKKIGQTISAEVRFIFDESALRLVYRVDGQPCTDASDTVNGVEVGPFICLNLSV